MPYQNFVKRSEIQFVYPVPKGSKLIFFTPFRVGVNEENQFTDYELDKIINTKI